MIVPEDSLGTRTTSYLPDLEEEEKERGVAPEERQRAVAIKALGKFNLEIQVGTVATSPVSVLYVSSSNRLDSNL